MSVRTISSLADVSAAEWNALELHGNPFLRHEFLFTLEQQHCADRHTGWQPMHLLLHDESTRQLLGAVPLYLKKHSWGEFVFDWSWASAYSQQGLEYYPKLTSAVPFTPASGPRLLVNSNTDAARTRSVLAEALQATARQLRVSSAHVLFAEEADIAALQSHRYLSRCDCQFHWRNRTYADFDQFIGTFRADKRKKALRERRRVVEAGIRFETRSGHEMTDDLWHQAFAMSAGTFARHGHEHYLTVDFFKAIARVLPDSIVAILAFYQQQPVAVAICFRGENTLYGRYWGQTADFHSLHFETCYYQGIEYCIRHGLTLFEPGTQGEHKVARGFEPALTWSAHWIADERFEHALGAHLSKERSAVTQYQEAMREHLPFHRAS